MRRITVQRNWFVALAVGIASAAGVVWALLKPTNPTIDEVRANRLASEGEQLWEKYGRGTRASETVPVNDWPDEIRRFQPESVTVTREGIFIKLSSFYVTAKGIFVLPEASQFQPTQGSDPSFRHLRGRVYCYEIQG
jgi:hypothetical protein